nr:uncharacterized protein LOC102410588 isoform X3 [Bubalus bubalis]
MTWLPGLCGWVEEGGGCSCYLNLTCLPCPPSGYRACTSSQVHWFCDDGWGTPSLRQDISSLNFLNWLLDHNCPGWNRIAEPADHCQGPVGQSPAVFLSGGRSCHERECLSSVTRDSVPDDSSTSVPPLVKTGSSVQTDDTCPVHLHTQAVHSVTDICLAPASGQVVFQVWDSCEETDNNPIPCGAEILPEAKCTPLVAITSGLTILSSLAGPAGAPAHGCSSV